MVVIRRDRYYTKQRPWPTPSTLMDKVWGKKGFRDVRNKPIVFLEPKQNVNIYTGRLLLTFVVVFFLIYKNFLLSHLI